MSTFIDFPPRPPRPMDGTSVPIPPAQLPTFFNDGSWRQDAAFYCRECGSPSYEETGDEKRRGCRTCGYITRYSDKHFDAKNVA